MSKRKRQDVELSQDLEAPKCDDHLVHLESVRSTQSQVLPTEKAQQLAEVFSLLGDTNRLRLISALAAQELCVCDLAVVTKMTESAICHQLRLLKAMRLVNYRREGRNVYYSLADGHIVTLYTSLAEHLEK
jgi:ArsR family transcriptional regulator, lead/cadmium/zinc/bismuth-responsive transcriptional repressor